MAHAVSAEDLTFTYRGGSEPAIRQLNLSLEDGQTTVLMGRGGAGKSTFCYTLNGLVPRFHRGDFQGRVLVYGTDVARQRVHENSRLVGLVFQDFESQLFSTNVELEVAFGLENHGLQRDRIRRRVDRYLEVVALTALRHRQPANLSGGQKQRLAIASVLAMEARLVCMDEPSTDLDPQGRDEVLGLTARLARAGRTLVLVDHEAETALLGDRVLVMDGGRVVLDGPPSEVLTRVEALRAAGVRPPAVAELFHALGRSPIPVTVEGALEALKAPPRPLNGAAPSKPAAGNILDAREVSYRYPEADAAAVSSVDFTLGEGEFVALLGANGSGKTTLAKLLNGLLHPSNGEIRLGERNLGQLRRSELAREVGYVFQNPDHQIFAATVREEVGFGPKNFGLQGSELGERVAEALQATGLEGYGERDPFALTKGERQQVAVASVLATRPRILILDEPTTGLDWPQQQAMMALLQRLNERGHTVVIITHSMRLAAEYARRVAVMEGGQLIADGHPRRVFFDSQVLQRAALRAPQIVSLSAALGLPALTVEELASRL